MPKRIYNFDDKMVEATPDIDDVASTARDIIDTATTHKTDVSAVVTKHTNTLVVHHYEDDSLPPAARTLGAIAQLTQDLATTIDTTPQHINDMTAQVLDDDDTNN